MLPARRETPLAPASDSQLAPAVRWLSVVEAAEALGCDPRHVRRLCAQGRLAARQDAAGIWTIDPTCQVALALAAGIEAPIALAGQELAHLTSAQRAEVHRRLEAIHAYRIAMDRRPPGDGVADWRRDWLAAWNLARRGRPLLARTTILRWDQLLREHGLSGMVDRRGAPGGTACSDEAWETFLGLYLSENRPSMPRLWEIVAALAQANGWDWPALRTVQSRVQRGADPRLKAAGRNPRQFRDRCLPAVQRDAEQIPAMGLWVADHRRFDVMIPRRVWNPKQKRDEWRWFRPWITAFLDYRTWKPPCWRIRFESPDGNVVMETFVAGVIEHGKPDDLYLDNGKDFRMYRFSGGRNGKAKPARAGEPIVAERYVKPLLVSLGVKPHFAQPYNAKAKVIEPWFRLMAKDFDKRWPTYCGHNTESRPEGLKKLNHKAAEMAAAGYTLEAFADEFDRWVRNDYDLRPSPAAAAGGLSPARAFVELRDPDFVAVRPSIEALMLLLMPSQRVRVEPEGVYVPAFGRHYDSPCLEDRRCGSGRDLARKVAYRYRESDPSKVFVFDGQTDAFVCVAEPYVGAGIHPLADAGSEDAARLSDAIALRKGLAKRMNARVRELRAVANTHLAAQAAAAGVLGGLDDPRTIPAAPPPTIRIAGATSQFQLAADAGRAADRRSAATEAASAVADALGDRPLSLSLSKNPAGNAPADAWDLLIAATSDDGPDGDTDHGDPADRGDPAESGEIEPA